MASLKIIVLFLITILHHTPLSFTQEIAPLKVHNTSLNLYPLPSREDSFRSIFSKTLHFVTVRAKTTGNIVCSPVAVYNSLAFIYLGAEGTTGKEIKYVLLVKKHDKIRFASKYGELLKTKFSHSKDNDEAPQLSMAIRLYVNNKLKILDSFNKVAQKIFGYKAVNINFDQPLTAVGQINNWVEQKTEQRIRNFLKPNDVNDRTANILINAIHFKAKWLFPFSKNNTKQSVFYINNDKKTEVELMYQNARIRYTKLRRLDAQAIELPYKNSTISMLILLPNRVEGFKKLENRLPGEVLNEVIAQMVVESVDVYLPKFRIQSDINLKRPLRRMGIYSLLKPDADLSGIFQNAGPTHISEFRQKVFFDCNEGGSEAAADTYMKSKSRNFATNKKIFNATHPFVFVVRNENIVLFSGHVTMG